MTTKKPCKWTLFCTPAIGNLQDEGPHGLACMECNAKIHCGTEHKTARAAAKCRADRPYEFTHPSRPDSRRLIGLGTTSTQARKMVETQCQSSRSPSQS